MTEVQCKNCGCIYETDLLYEGSLCELVECFLCNRNPDDDSSVSSTPVVEKPVRHYKKRKLRTSNILVKKSPTAKPSRYDPRKKWTQEIDEFIIKNKLMKNYPLLKAVQKKFGIKSTIAGIAYHICQKGLRSSNLRQAAESLVDEDVEEDLKKLPPVGGEW